MKHLMITKRHEADVARLYVEARVAGLEISHYGSWDCHVFNGAPRPNCELGVFRQVGTVIFYKQERRWEVRASTDCNPVDLATLINCGLYLVEKYGRTPGHFTRRRYFTHKISGRTDKSIAYAGVCFQLTADDLLGTTTAAVSEPIDVTIQSILETTG